MKHLLRSMLLGLVLSGPTLAHAAEEETYTINIPPGLSLIANQLDRGGNTLDEIMPVVPDGSVLKLQDADAKFVSVATYSKANASWNPNNLTLQPGQGIFFENNSAAFNLTFKGTRRAPAWPIPEVYKKGLHLVSSPVPLKGDLKDVPIFGDMKPCGPTYVHKYNGTGFDRYLYDPDLGDEWHPNMPTFAVGEAFYLDISTPCPKPRLGLNPLPPKNIECGADWNFDPPSVVNACEGPAPTIAIVSTITNGTCPGTIIRTYEAIDACDNRATCSQTINVSAEPGGPDCPPTPLTIRYVDGVMVVSWNGSGYQLQRASELNQPWQSIAQAISPYVVAPTEEARFFRLLCR